MFCRLTRLIAVFAVVNHVWLSLVVAPWHELVGHVLPTVQSRATPDHSKPVRRCSCRHHAHCNNQAPKSRQALPGSSDGQPVPSDHDHCAVCQVLAQPVAHPDAPDPVVTCVGQEFMLPVPAVPQITGLQINPVSRGPPTV